LCFLPITTPALALQLPCTSSDAGCQATHLTDTARNITLLSWSSAAFGTGAHLPGKLWHLLKWQEQRSEEARAFLSPLFARGELLF